MSDEIEDRDFYQAAAMKQAEKNNALLIKTMNDLVAAIGRLSNTKSIEELVSKINSLPTPQVTVTNNQPEIVAAMSKMTEAVNGLKTNVTEEIQKLNKDKKWEFTFERNNQGVITKVIAK